MLTDPTPEARQGMSWYVIVTLVVLLIGAVYVGGVFYSRWRSNKAIAQHAAETEREHDGKVYEAMGGDRFDILGFFAHPAIINRGDSTSLCYSVSNAKTVTLEPQSNAVWPAFERCVSVSPKKTTTYTLTAIDANGNVKTRTVEVDVQ
jgi:hypothetical protein